MHILCVQANDDVGHCARYVVPPSLRRGCDGSATDRPAEGAGRLPVARESDTRAADERRTGGLLAIGTATVVGGTSGGRDARGRQSEEARRRGDAGRVTDERRARDGWTSAERQTGRRERGGRRTRDGRASRRKRTCYLQAGLLVGGYIYIRIYTSAHESRNAVLDSSFCKEDRSELPFSESRVGTTTALTA